LAAKVFFLSETDEDLTQESVDLENGPQVETQGRRRSASSSKRDDERERNMKEERSKDDVFVLVGVLHL